MSFYGMDVDQVRQLANQMSQAAGEIESLSAQLTSALNSTQWVGPDQQRFMSEWTSQHSPNLRNVCQGLHQAAQLAIQNANQQEQASTGN
ncbi:MAG: hypothetical protein HKL80_10440 [Acidimicrobiales bacterium]|nr:hypothetical protein [Acidimicrobiales bacterium]